MHELGLADAMLKMVRKAVAGEGRVAVRSVTVELGDLSGVVPRFLEEAWTAVCDGTELAETPLVLHAVPATARCGDCGTVFVIDPAGELVCPDCRGDKLTPLSGQDLTIAEIEVADIEE